MSDVLLETDFAWTIFDWQNVVFVGIAFAIMRLAKWIFQRVYTAEIAAQQQHDGLARTTSAAKAAEAAADPDVWWRHATAEPAVLMCLGAYVLLAHFCSRTFC